MALINLANFVACTEAEGPGRRAAVWVQGCLKRCTDCCNQAYLPISPRQLVDPETVLAWVRAAKAADGIEGITFLGGEPMLQARGLAALARGCRDEGLSVMIFSGYTVAELDLLRLDGVPELLAVTDVLVDGPYLPELRETRRNWAGSTNQRFLYLTDRYSGSIETDPAGQHSIEIRVGSCGEVRVNGWPVGHTPVEND